MKVSLQPSSLCKFASTGLPIIQVSLGAILLFNEAVGQENANSAVVTDQAVDLAWRAEVPELTESSGLAFSLRGTHHLWSHNDSGGDAILYAIDAATGKQSGACRLGGVEPRDWEDMASFEYEGKPMLLVADCGDNRQKRDFIELILLPEPSPDQDTTLSPSEFARLRVRYPGGPMDCEAVWYDDQTKRVVMMGKRGLPFVSVYEVAISEFSETDSSAKTVDAELITRVALPAATGADRDPASGDIWVVTYWQAWNYTHSNAKSLAEQLTQPPAAYAIPRWKQIEAIAVDANSRVWLSTEGSPAIMGRLRRAADENGP